MSAATLSVSATSFQPTLVEIPNGDPGVRYAIVPRFDDGYAAGDDGSIWSRKLHFRYGHGGWRKLKPYPLVHEYLGLSVKSPNTGKPRPWPVHVMVTEAWHGPRLQDMFCRHLNDIRTDNRSCNLAWGTRSDNMLDRGRNGDPTFCGDDHPMAVLTTETVVALRKMVRDGATVLEAARYYEVSAEAAYGAVRGRSWSHIPGSLGTKYTSLTKAEKLEIKQLASQGLSVKEIMEITGHTYFKVYGHAVRPAPTTR